MLVKGYLNPSSLGRAEVIELLTPEGERRSISIEEVKSVYFVREFDTPFQLEQKTFLSRPKLEGLWVRLRIRDEDVMEGIVSSDLVDLLNSGVRLTPPDVRGNTLHLYVPSSALLEMKGLGVVGVGRRGRRMPADAGAAAALAAQSKVFSE